MFATIPITPWHWIGFLAFVFVVLALDLGIFHRRAHVVKFREALLWTAVWFCLAMLFALWFKSARGQKEALQFVTGYLLELSLSMDNVFVMALIFAYFKIPSQHQHRVLFWGILGAVVMRGAMIGLGVALIQLLDWILYVFGALLIFSGIKMLFVETEVHPERSLPVRLIRQFYPVSPQLDGQKLVTDWNGRRALTPLALVLLLIESTDLIFALDSIPAVFAVTRKPFIVFTSNIFAILGLRSLYFVLAGAISYFRYLKYGLALVLVFIGIKMVVDPGEGPPRWWFQYDISTGQSLIVIAVIIGTAIILSVIRAQSDKRKQARSENTRPDSGTGQEP